MSDSYEISVQVDEAYLEMTPAERLREAAAETLKRHGAHPEAELSLVVTDDEAVRDLNFRFLGIDAPTDVLAFPAGEAMPGEDESGEMDLYLGDIVIAHPYTAAQAAQENHLLDHALILLAVHGTLHLLGFDHDTPENRAEMWQAQEAVLQAVGVPADVAPSLNAFSDEEVA